MSKRTVPTPATLDVWTGGLALASSTKTSWSGSVSITIGVPDTVPQSWPSSSTQAPAFHLTINPLHGKRGVGPGAAPLGSHGPGKGEPGGGPGATRKPAWL